MKKPILSAAILATGLVLTAACFGYFYKEARVVVTDQTKSISVKGYAEKNISSDKATWTGTLITRQALYRRLTSSWNSSESRYGSTWREKIYRKRKLTSLLYLPKPGMK